MVEGVTPCLTPFCSPAQTLGSQHALSKKQGKMHWRLRGSVHDHNDTGWSAP